MKNLVVTSSIPQHTLLNFSVEIVVKKRPVYL